MKIANNKYDNKQYIRYVIYKDIKHCTCNIRTASRIELSIQHEFGDQKFL